MAIFGFNLSTNQPKELIYRVSDLSQAEIYADAFDLQLISVSKNGIARFKTSNQSQVDEAIEFGFVYNHQTNTFVPPWQRTEDPFLKDQYALNMMQTTDAWKLTEGSEDVIVAIIDTGIDPNHDEFVGRISQLSYNAYTETVGINSVVDDHGHGTMVAGVIGANKDNSKGIAGIAQNIKLLIIKANVPKEGRFLDSTLIEGIYYAANNGADIINLSLGGSYANALTESAINYAVSKGVIVVAAAGNDGTNDLIYPAAFENVIAVSAVDKNRLIASYSNYGDHIDLAAPGSDIITTARNNGYVTTSGTSFAAPQIAGVLALLKSHFREIERSEYITKLLSATMDEGSLGKDEYYGYGIANTYYALTNEFVLFTFETYDADPIIPMLLLKDMPTELPRPTLPQHVFEGWFFDEAFTQPWIDYQTIPEQDAILYAKFDPSFITITFVSEGIQIDAMVIEKGTTVELPTSVLDDHRFMGWTFDEENLIPYDNHTFYKDVTLYAHFEVIIYFSVTLLKQNELLDVLVFEVNTFVLVNEITVEGHDFYGWYIDEDFYYLYQPSELIDNIILYGDYRVKVFLITFITFDGLKIDDLSVVYGEVAELPVAEKLNYFFIDWYIDIDLIMPYVNTPINKDLLLYAKFVQSAFSITYIIDGEIYLSMFIESNETFEMIEPMKVGYEFLGWYLDEEFSILYQYVPINSNLILYGKLVVSEHEIRFFNFDNHTVFYSIVVSHGTILVLPEGPLHPENETFEYKFLRWNHDGELVKKDLDIFPIYAFRFKPDSLQFNPGIDTITVGETWVDAGISLMDENLSVTVLTDIDWMIPGKYKISYQIHKESILIYEAYRYVRVLEDFNNIELKLNPGIDTIFIGQDHKDGGLRDIDMQMIEVINGVNRNIVGVYEIIYRYQINGFSYEIKRFVHVVEEQIVIDSRNMSFDMPKRKDEEYEIIS